MNDYPRTIDNGAGEKLTFHGTRSDERGEYVEATNSVSPGSGPPRCVTRAPPPGATGAAT
jgi:hypothetical protein